MYARPFTIRFREPPVKIAKTAVEFQKPELAFVSHHGIKVVWSNQYPATTDKLEACRTIFATDRAFKPCRRLGNLQPQPFKSIMR